MCASFAGIEHFPSSRNGGILLREKRQIAFGLRREDYLVVYPLIL